MTWLASFLFYLWTVSLAFRLVGLAVATVLWPRQQYHEYQLYSSFEFYTRTKSPMHPESPPELNHQRSTTKAHTKHQFITRLRKLRDNARTKRDSFLNLFRFGDQAAISAKIPQIPIETQKLCFTLSTFIICVIFYVALKLPQYMIYLYTALFIPLYCYRYVIYRRLFQYPYCFDFCYFDNILTIIAIFTNSPLLLSTALTVSSGVFFATVMWRNSLVYHSIDKMTSCFIHYVPMLSLMVHFHIVSKDSPVFDAEYTIARHFLNGMVFYLIWQTFTVFVFDYMNADLMSATATPRLESSIRYFVNNQDKHAIAQILLKFARSIQFFAPTQKFQDDHVRTKIVFYSFQFVYMATLTPIGWVMCSSKIIATVFLAFFFLVLVHEAGSYYLSDTYLKLKVHEMITKYELVRDKKLKMDSKFLAALAELQKLQPLDSSSTLGLIPSVHTVNHHAHHASTTHDLVFDHTTKPSLAKSDNRKGDSDANTTDNKEGDDAETGDEGKLTNNQIPPTSIDDRIKID